MQQAARAAKNEGETAPTSGGARSVIQRQNLRLKVQAIEKPTHLWNI